MGACHSKSGNSIKWNDRHRKMANNNLKWSRSTFLALSLSLTLSLFLTSNFSPEFLLQNAKWRRREEKEQKFIFWIVFSTIIIISQNFMWHFFFIWIIMLVKWTHEHWKCAHNLQLLVIKMGQLFVTSKEQRKNIQNILWHRWDES